MLHQLEESLDNRNRHSRFWWIYIGQRKIDQSIYELTCCTCEDNGESLAGETIISQNDLNEHLR